MSRVVFDFLTESPLWVNNDRGIGLSDADLRAELKSYREHVLQNPSEKVSGLGICFGARDRRLNDHRDVKRSVMYFDEVLIPDPLFSLTERIEDSRLSIHRDGVSSAVDYMRELMPLVRLGKVRFVETAHVLESPAGIPLLSPDDYFESLVPEDLRNWFHENARVRKVIVSVDGLRRVMGQPPDLGTRSIHVDFGQIGRHKGYDFAQLIKVSENGAIAMRLDAPSDEKVLDRWIYQSVNKSASDYLEDVAADAQEAWRLGCSYATACEVTANLLHKIQTKRVDAQEEANAILQLDLPVVDAASIADISALIQSDLPALRALTIELRQAAESLAEIEDLDEKTKEAQVITKRISREQVYEVERKLLESRRGFLSDGLPIASATLAAGVFAYFAAGGGAMGGLATFFTSLAGLGAERRTHNAYKALPGYFLWKLKNRIATNG
jgi:hypothetical protein